MTISAAALAELKSTLSAKFATDLAARVEKAYEAFVTRDTFGSEGYVPFLIGGVGAGQEWTDTRVMRAINEYGIRYVGKLYENSVKIKKTTLADNIAAKAATIGAKMAVSADAHEEIQAYNVLASNPNGFDGDPLFGLDHKYSDAEGADTFANVIDGAAAAWYLVNKEALIIADREGEGYTAQVYGGDNTEIDFVEDSLAIGWRARKIFAPGFWANAMKCKTALTADNLQSAIALKATFKNDTGELLGNPFTHLVVGRSNEAAALKLLKAALINGGDTNVYLNRLQLIVSDQLA